MHIAGYMLTSDGSPISAKLHKTEAAAKRELQRMRLEAERAGMPQHEIEARYKVQPVPKAPK